MAHPPSASKRHRQSLRRRERNRVRRGAARTAVRRARELIEAGQQEEAQEAVRQAASIMDRAARRGVLHANNAARRKSRLMHQLKTSQATTGEAEAPKRRTRATAKTRASSTRTKSSTRTTKSRSKKS